MHKVASLVVSTLCACTSALRVAPCARRAVPVRARLVASAVDERPRDAGDPEETPEERTARLEALGRAAAAEASALDSAADDGGLMAEFNARLDQEGGANLFKLKTSVTPVTDAAQDAQRKAKRAADDLAYKAGGVTSGLTEQQKNIGKIIVGLILFQVLIGAIGSAFSGGGASYSV